MPSSPAFQFYPGDFMSDENQMLMTCAEAGAYIRLMCVCWREGSIPTELRKLAKLVGSTPREMGKLWPALEPCFESHPSEPDRLVHPRLEREREKQEQHARKMREAGRKGAHAKHGKKSPEPQGPNGGKAIAKPELGHSSAVALQSSSSSSPSGLTTTSPPTPSSFGPTETAGEPDAPGVGFPIEVSNGSGLRGAHFVHPGKRLSASQVLQAWESKQPARLADSQRRKHWQVAKRIADEHSAEDVMLAFIGMGGLFPHCPPRNQPWDLFDLERKFPKAIASAQNHPELRNRQREAELLQLLEAV